MAQSNNQTIPEFNDLTSMAVALRAMKDIVEQLAGLRQGGSLGAPGIFVQPSMPVPARGISFRKKDLWIHSETNVMSYWTGAKWQAIA